MKIDKALEILDDIKDSGIDAGHYDAEEAIELGIEALKRIEILRHFFEAQATLPLPGETPE